MFAPLNYKKRMKLKSAFAKVTTLVTFIKLTNIFSNLSTFCCTTLSKTLLQLLQR